MSVIVHSDDLILQYVDREEPSVKQTHFSYFVRFAFSDEANVFIMGPDGHSPSIRALQYYSGRKTTTAFLSHLNASTSIAFAYFEINCWAHYIAAEDTTFRFKKVPNGNHTDTLNVLNIRHTSNSPIAAD